MNSILLTMSPLEKLTLGGNTMLLGLVMVFVVLGLLIGLVSLIKAIMVANDKRKANKKAKALEAKSDIVIDEVQEQKQVVVSNDEEVVAAISAAISMYYEVQLASTGKSVKFRVRSIKEIR